MNILLLPPSLQQKKGPISWAKNYSQKESGKNMIGISYQMDILGK